MEKTIEGLEDYINLGILREKKAKGGIVKGKPKLAKKGWK